MHLYLTGEKGNFYPKNPANEADFVLMDIIPWGLSCCHGYFLHVQPSINKMLHCMTSRKIRRNLSSTCAKLWCENGDTIDHI